MVFKKMDGADAPAYTARVGCRLTADEHARLLAEADAHGVTLSQLVRGRVVGATLISRIDSQMINELRRQGGLLKHITIEKEGAIDSAAVSETLTAIRDLILELSDRDR